MRSQHTYSIQCACGRVLAKVFFCEADASADAAGASELFVTIMCPGCGKRIQISNLDQQLRVVGANTEAG
jgi:hypothetical protein